MRRSFHPLLSIAIFLLCCCTGLTAQTITANINGTVTDASGAVISNAKITAVNVDTNVQTTTTSNNQGIYDIRFLQIGNYTVTVDADGFAKRVFGPFTLEANQVAKVDASMAVGNTQSRVSVDASVAPLLNTENAQLATTLDTKAIGNIPMVGQNWVQLTLFVPGAINTNPSALAGNGAIGVNQAVNNGVSVNGNRQQANNYSLDGIEINETLNNTVGYNVAPDALGQLQLTSANAQAEYGNVNGGDVIAILKSGTNQFHGSGYWYLSNYHLDANTWGNRHNAVITPKQSYTQPIFGGTIGGPVLHNRLFFFADYSGGRYHQGGVATATVMTAKMRTGDFSELLDPGIMCTSSCSPSKLIQLYDSSTTAYTPYVGNKNVPILSPVAQYLFAHPEIYPLPNQAPQAGTPATGNYVAPQKNRQYNDQFDVKADYKITEKDTLSARWIQSDSGTTTTPVLLVSFPTAPITPVKGVAINEVHTFNASTVNELRLGYNRIRPEAGFPVDATGAFGTNGNSVVGIPGGNQGIVGFAAQTTAPGSTSGLTTANGAEYTTIGNSYGGMTFVDNSFTYGDNLTWLKDKHTFKFGAQFIRYQSNCFSSGNDGVLGTMAYTGVSSSNPINNATTNPEGYNTGGYSMADFVLDRVDYIGQGAFTGPQGLRQWRDAYFAQDDWKITPTLTLNLGMRYEFDQPMYEVNNKYANVDFNTKQLIHAGVNGASRSLVHPYYGGLMPRIGFSWAVTPRFVVRGGYGMQSFMEATGEARRMTLNPPNNADNYTTGTAPSASNAAVFFKVESGFTNPATVNPVLALNAWDVNIRPALIGEYSLTTEYQVSHTASFQIGYVGESGQHLVNHNAANQLYSPCVIGGVVQTRPTSAACTAADPSPFQSLVTQSGSVTLTTSNAMMNYNALQATLRQRAARGLQYTLNYTWSRAMTNSIGFFGAPSINGANNYAENGYNNHAEYGPTGQDVRNSVNGNLVYELPFGRGRRFGANMNSVLDEFVGGWKVAMTGVAYSGFPVTINNSSNNAYTLNKIQRANHLRQMKIVSRSVRDWFGTDPSATSCGLVDNGTCAYASPQNGTYGDAAVGSERAPGYQGYDSSVSKAFTVFHEQFLEFRVDASNVFNLTALSNPNNTAQSATFGQITSVRSGPRKLQLDLKYIF
jgi:Carboxypeptidase regulatory-like domain/TonB dependent receptor